MLVKRLLILLVIISLSASCGGGGGSAAPSAPPVTSSVVMAGDSLTYAGDWNTLLNADISNCGVSGLTTDELILMLPDILRSKPLKIFILIGINDLRTGVSEAVIVPRYAAIIQACRDNSPATVIHFQSVLPVSDSAMIARIVSLNSALQTLCAVEEIQYINLYPSFLCGDVICSPLTTDGLHLTEQGYETWAAVLAFFI